MAERNPLDWLKTEGWPALNPEATDAEKLAATKALLEEFETAKLFHAVFAFGRGPELLDHLRAVTIETPIYARDQIAFNALEIPLSPEQYVWVRVGQQSVFHHIRAMLMKAVEGPPDVEGDQRNGDKSTN